jgi:hypothetical protein
MRIAQSSFAKRRFAIKTICLLTFLIFSKIFLAGAASVADQIAAIKAQKNDAIFSVQHIVNQPITHLKRTPSLNVAIYTPAWFHDGALTPDFDHVDIRTTQELVYQGHKYVSSDANPTEAFLGDELEFNSMTKYFYTDRSLPKKKLTEAEMLQVNDLYRVIGHCNQQLEELQNPEPSLTKIQRILKAHKSAVIAVIGVLLVLFIFMRKKRTQEFEN